MYATAVRLAPATPRAAATRSIDLAHPLQRATESKISPLKGI
jgi:hypothetical protein